MMKGRTNNVKEKPRVFHSLRLVALLLLVLMAAPFARAQQGRLVRITVHGTSLEKNLTGESPDRAVAIYLPPSYDSVPTRRYPVVYLLHGIGDTEKEFTVEWSPDKDPWGTITGVMNRGIADGRFGEMIIVMPDERTKMLGSFFTNSVATGNWEDFTTGELVSYIDQHYRTLARPESRGIAGHSMGGYGAIKLGMKHPDIYSVVYGMNPALLGWGGDVSAENPAFAPLFKMASLEDVYAGGHYLMGAMALAQAFSPNPGRPPFYADLPFAPVNGKLEPSQRAFSKWEENFPIFMAPRYKANLAKLRGLRFDTAWEDEFSHIPITTRALSHVLTDLGIAHIFEEYNGNHRNRMWGRMGRLHTEVLPYFWLLLDSQDPKNTNAAKPK